MRSNEVMDQMSPRGKALARVGGGGSCFGCLRLNCEASLQLGRLSWNALACVYCVRGSGGDAPPEKFLNLRLLKWLELHLRLI